MSDEKRVADAMASMYHAHRLLRSAADDRLWDLAVNLVELHDELSLLYLGSTQTTEEDHYVDTTDAWQ